MGNVNSALASMGALANGSNVLITYSFDTTAKDRMELRREVTDVVNQVYQSFRSVDLSTVTYRFPGIECPWSVSHYSKEHSELMVASHQRLPEVKLLAQTISGSLICDAPDGPGENISMRYTDIPSIDDLKNDCSGRARDCAVRSCGYSTQFMAQGDPSMLSRGSMLLEFYAFPDSSQRLFGKIDPSGHQGKPDHSVSDRHYAFMAEAANRVSLDGQICDGEWSSLTGINCSIANQLNNTKPLAEIVRQLTTLEAK